MKVLRLFPLLALLLLASCQREQDNNVNPDATALPAEDGYGVWAPLSGDVDADLKRIYEELGKPAPVTRASIVALPAGSVNALAAAINSAGPGGAVVLLSGNHREDNTVIVPHSVTILGAPGAILRSGTTPLQVAGSIVPALHVKAPGCIIAGIDFRPLTNSGEAGNAVLLDEAPASAVLFNRMRGYQFGILVEKSDYCSMLSNTLVMPTYWQTLPGIPVMGIIVINGKNCLVRNNEVSNAFFGVWCCDEDGVYRQNYTHGCYVGMILCKVPMAYPLPGGITGAAISGQRWDVRNNRSDNNFTAGYLVIDGAGFNNLVNNSASGNGAYDIELVGDSNRFGFFTPSCFNNRVAVGPYPGLTVKDCGLNNTVIGGTAINTTLDPCN